PTFPRPLFGKRDQRAPYARPARCGRDDDVADVGGGTVGVVVIDGGEMNESNRATVIVFSHVQGPVIGRVLENRREHRTIARDHLSAVASRDCAELRQAWHETEDEIFVVGVCRPDTHDLDAVIGSWSPPTTP